MDNLAQREIQRLTEEMKQEKKLKKKLKQQGGSSVEHERDAVFNGMLPVAGKKAPSPTFDPDEEANMDRAAQELAKKLASMRSDLAVR